MDEEEMKMVVRENGTHKLVMVKPGIYLVVRKTV